MKILVTGAAGFLGSHLASRLEDDGHDVMWLDNRIPDSDRGVRFHLGRDNPSVLFELVKGVDIVYHLAAMADVRACAEDPDEAWSSNVQGTFDLLQACLQEQVDSFVLASSMAIWADASDRSAHDAPAPGSWYGATKAAAEAAVWGAKTEEDSVLDTTILRFGNVVGAGMTRYLLHDTINKIQASPDHIEMLGDGWNTRSFLYVDDAIEAMLLLPNDDTGIFNVCNDDAITVKRAVELVCEVMDVDPEVVWETKAAGWHGDTRNGHPHNGLAKRAGWHPSLPASSAVRQATADLISHGISE